MRIGLWIFALGMLVWSACVPPEPVFLTEVNIDHQNPEYQRLYDFQDRQALDSIWPFGSHADPTYRYAAAMAFASYQDSMAIDSLAAWLSDPIEEVRSAAAYALGQLRQEKAEPMLIEAFRQQDTININNVFNGRILEAIGKCGSTSSLASLSTVSTYRTSDDQLLLGQARAIYRFGLRGMVTAEGTARMVDFVTDNNYPEATRLMASNYLFRTKDLDLTDYKFRLAKTFAQDTDPNIRMTLATALGRTADPQILNTLLSQLSVEDDYRVQCNIVRALSNYPYIDVIERVLLLLRDENHHVSTTAAQFLIDNGNPNDAVIYANYARDSIHWRARAMTYQAVLKHLPYYYTNSRARLRREIVRAFDDSANPYERRALLRAIGEDFSQYEWIKNQSFADSNAVVRIGGVEILGRILRDDRFNTIFRSGRRAVRRRMLSHLEEAFRSGDVGMITEAAHILADPKAGIASLFRDSMLLDETKKLLTLPKDVEAYQAVQTAIHSLKGLPPPDPVQLSFSHPIDWPLVAEISDSTRAYIFTNKGRITLRFFVKEAPGSVANFIQLANDHFFDGKVFHRVVPNFVIQGGCPRGDGYGSLDYSIRSELPPLYYDRAGLVGMASAGNHTEGTQWFITHAPTPHLDGRYTIFAEVIEGLDIVHAIDVGDVIEDVRILKL